MRPGAAASRALLVVLIPCVLLVPAALRARLVARQAKRPSEVPIAFWAWRSAAPSQADVDAAMVQTGASTLFLRAGQLDYDSGSVRRVRAPTGVVPANVDVHLVYNATGRLLGVLGGVDPREIAREVCRCFVEDGARARVAGARIVGIQLDVDVPTRLLPQYGRILASVREGLASSAALSVTGLPTWMASDDLALALASVDFWVPQCYGAWIPKRVEDTTCIASESGVQDAVERASALGVPFMAGLAAYGYALHYGADGALVGLTGDLDAAVVVADNRLAMVERGPAGGGAPEASEWRYVFHASASATLGRLMVRKGDTIVLHVPTAGALRAQARGVRACGGDALRGICVFRMPSTSDPTTLSLAEVTAALADRVVEPSLSARATSSGDRVRLRFASEGACRSALGDGAVRIVVHLPGALRASPYAENSSEAETVFEEAKGATVPCSPGRANAIRVSRSCWDPGDSVSFDVCFAGAAPSTLEATVSLLHDDGTEERRDLSLVIEPEIGS